MKCLHEETASFSTTKNGSFWFCGQKPSCGFICSEDEGFLFEKAIDAWRSTKQLIPLCGGHHMYAKMRVVKDVMKRNYGRPFFVCSDKKNPCSFWIWGDVQPGPSCYHGQPSSMKKVEKEGPNKGRMFFCCSMGISCNYFQWEDSSRVEEPYIPMFYKDSSSVEEPHTPKDSSRVEEPYTPKDSSRVEEPYIPMFYKDSYCVEEPHIPKAYAEYSSLKNKEIINPPLGPTAETKTSFRSVNFSKIPLPEDNYLATEFMNSFADELDI